MKSALSAISRTQSSPKFSILVIGANTTEKKRIQKMTEGQAYHLEFTELPDIDKLEASRILSNRYQAYLINSQASNQQEEAYNFSLLQRLNQRSNNSLTPVIFQTDSDHTDQIQHGLEHGAYFYLLKPYTQSLFLSVLEAAKNCYNNHQALQDDLESLDIAQSNLQSACFHIKTLEDARSLSCMLAFTTPNPKEAVVGLYELMANAIEHGNLKISYPEKTELVKSGKYQSEIKRRQALLENKDKVASIEFERHADYVQYTISDAGEGFNFPPFLEFSVERAMDNHGRGILIAKKLSFDELVYIDNGSTVIGRIYLNSSSIQA